MSVATRLEGTVRSRVSLRLAAAMRLEARQLRERRLAAGAEEKAAALEATRGEREAESRRERELDELISDNAERVREAATSKKQRQKEGEEGGGRREEGLVVVDGE